MKRIMYFAVASLALILSSCKGKTESHNETKPRNIVLESFTYDIIGEDISSDTLAIPGGKYVRFIGQGVLPQDIGDTEILHLRDTLMKMAHIEITTDGKPMPEMPDSMLSTSLDPVDTEACGEDFSNLTTTLVTPRVVVWENKRESYACGAAHGNQSTAFINFSMLDGKIIEYQDLFKENYQKQLTRLVRNKLKDSSYQLLVSIDSIQLPKEFAITSNGILFSYDPYEIAPYSEGTVSIELETGEIIDILSNNGYFMLTGVMPQK